MDPCNIEVSPNTSLVWMLTSRFSLVKAFLLSQWSLSKLLISSSKQKIAVFNISQQRHLARFLRWDFWELVWLWLLTLRALAFDCYSVRALPPSHLRGPCFSPSHLCGVYLILIQQYPAAERMLFLLRHNPLTATSWDQSYRNKCWFMVPLHLTGVFFPVF